MSKTPPEDLQYLSTCALSNRKKREALSEEDLLELYSLPCGCEEVPLRDLLEDYVCNGCDEAYFYSFCLEDVAQDNCTWHCKICKSCKDWQEWHCTRCNRCTYGFSSACEHCGKKSKLAKYLD